MEKVPGGDGRRGILGASVQSGSARFLCFRLSSLEAVVVCHCEEPFAAVAREWVHRNPVDLVPSLQVQSKLKVWWQWPILLLGEGMIGRVPTGGY